METTALSRKYTDPRPGGAWPINQPEYNAGREGAAEIESWMFAPEESSTPAMRKGATEDSQRLGYTRALNVPISL